MQQQYFFKCFFLQILSFCPGHLVASSKQIYDMTKNPRSDLRNSRIWRPSITPLMGPQVKNFWPVFIRLLVVLLIQLVMCVIKYIIFCPKD